MPRFVILRHDMPAGSSRGSHFDLMLEQGEMLRTWALADLPLAGQAVAAEALPDHRLAYLDYQGEVAGSRGSVSRVEAGEYQVVLEAPGSLEIQTIGTSLRGKLTLTRAGTDHWQAAFVPG